MMDRSAVRVIRIFLPTRGLPIRLTSGQRKSQQAVTTIGIRVSTLIRVSNNKRNEGTPSSLDHCNDASREAMAKLKFYLTAIRQSYDSRFKRKRWYSTACLRSWFLVAFPRLSRGRMNRIKRINRLAIINLRIKFVSDSEIDVDTLTLYPIPAMLTQKRPRPTRLTKRTRQRIVHQGIHQIGTSPARWFRARIRAARNWSISIEIKKKEGKKKDGTKNMSDRGCSAFVLVRFLKPLLCVRQWPMERTMMDQAATNIADSVQFCRIYWADVFTSRTAAVWRAIVRARNQQKITLTWSARHVHPRQIWHDDARCAYDISLSDSSVGDKSEKVERETVTFRNVP